MSVDYLDDEDTMWHHYGSREKYRAAMARQAYEEAVQGRRYAEAVVRSREEEVARVSGTAGEGVEWGDAGRKPWYEAELDEARDKLAAAWERERQARDKVEAADRLANPKPPTDAERQLADAKCALAEQEKRGPQIDAYLASARDWIMELRQRASREGDAVKAAQTNVAIAMAEAKVAELEAEKAELPKRVEWHNAWVAVKQAEVDGASPDEMLAALDALDEAS